MRLPDRNGRRDRGPLTWFQYLLMVWGIFKHLLPAMLSGRPWAYVAFEGRQENGRPVLTSVVCARSKEQLDEIVWKIEKHCYETKPLVVDRVKP